MSERTPKEMAGTWGSGGENGYYRLPTETVAERKEFERRAREENGLRPLGSVALDAMHDELPAEKSN